MTAEPPWNAPIPAPDAAVAEAARAHQRRLTKPPGSLGRLEDLAVRLAAQQGTVAPAAERVAIVVFAADHGVCDEGVSAFPRTVTAQMVANFAHGGAAVSVLARALDAGLEVVNVGTAEPTPPVAGVVDAMVARGTRNLAREPAMTPAERDAALRVGDDAAGRAADSGAELFVGGDMGIGNTTSAAALACALLEETPETLVGRGTGVDDAGLERKREAVARGLARHGTGTEPLAVLASLGGLEIAALTGAILGAARRRMPVLVDGFIVSVAALVAVRHAPAAAHWLHFAHRSAEAGHDTVLAALEAAPLLDLGMRLGEGSGAAMAVPLLRSACRVHNDMATFESAGVSDGG
ncbi:nicotinate-nucleotide--dimethylbenzimidazole phosphoribosyltransferase [Aquisalimonas lutea]|uniref:nicotinate-nucleotide--dimethylbenzimidazole phosphoribosyltransferase n=1 Tax=Aquisalimonas lutea TaxID=1327750 RepID=UPI0025B583DD|nr:nicotinate-nucleotide--dimethylbenzimidazole phosphoribosyltransferase [Aquisalimonas lutea]MDN3516741.1 nicotinate-nucleotide--dimethylbenzimidazole phosphoribosyltransferase [Aquisalimonas lutea]